MALRENQLEILVALSNGNGQGNNDLAIHLHGDSSSRGNFSTTLKNMEKRGIIKNDGRSGNYGKYNYHITKDLKIFECIIKNIFNKYYQYIMESEKLSKEYEILNARGAWADNRMVNFIDRANESDESKRLFSEALKDFTFSQYTGEIIKEYGIRDTLKAIPTMTVEDYIKFVDWADEKEFTKSEETTCSLYFLYHTIW